MVPDCKIVEREQCRNIAEEQCQQVDKVVHKRRKWKSYKIKISFLSFKSLPKCLHPHYPLGNTQVEEMECQDVTSEECTTVKERICDEVFEEECTVQEEEVGLNAN